jgi:exodeoxyribonuclease VII small subunit
MATRKTRFEDSLRRLEEIVGKLESGDTPLEQSFALFEEGMRLASECQERLERMRGRMEVLVRTKDGHRREPLDAEQRDEQPAGDDDAA